MGGISNLPRSNSEDSNSEKTAVAEFHGWLCVKGLEEMSERVSTWLEHTSDPPLEYLREYCVTLQFGGPPTLIKLLDRSHGNRDCKCGQVGTCTGIL